VFVSGIRIHSFRHRMGFCLGICDLTCDDWDRLPVSSVPPHPRARTRAVRVRRRRRAARCTCSAHPGPTPARPDPRGPLALQRAQTSVSPQNKASAVSFIAVSDVGTLDFPRSDPLDARRGSSMRMSDRPICAVANAERIGERELFQHEHPSPILEFEIIKLYPARGGPRANWPAVELIRKAVTGCGN
jgi:hypothetical protein